MKKKILSGFLTLVAMMTISTGSVFAQDLIKSTPSRADDVTAGEDVTQGKKTEYAEPESISDTTYESDKVVYIYATETSNVVISLPKTLIMGETTTPGIYSGECAVGISGDIAGSQNVVVTPEVTDSIAETGGKQSNLITTVTINDGDSLTVTANELLEGSVNATTRIVTSGVTSGTWKGALTFHVSVTNN